MRTILGIALLLMACRAAAAQSCCCECCGCQSDCQKVCRVVCEVKKVPKITYDCECEDFCVPGPSEHCIEYDECGCKHHVWTPTCGCVRTRAKLIKKEEFIEKTVYKCVVVNMCCRCAQNDKGAGTQNLALAPPQPPAAAAAAEVTPADYSAANAAAQATLAAEPTPAPSSRKLNLRRLLDPLAGKK